MHTHPKIFVLVAYNFEKNAEKGVPERRGRVFEVL